MYMPAEFGGLPSLFLLILEAVAPKQADAHERMFSRAQAEYLKAKRALKALDRTISAPNAGAMPCPLDG
jgi:hypothetical protein